jgi:hypothetical protein
VFFAPFDQPPQSKREKIMKRLFQVVSALALSALLAAPALAEYGLQSAMHCLYGASGTTNIAPNGTLNLTINNLWPNTWFECEVECVIYGYDFEASCSSDAQGKLKVSFPGAVDICIAPVVVVEFDEYEICANGVLGDFLED